MLISSFSPVFRPVPPETGFAGTGIPPPSSPAEPNIFPSRPRLGAGLARRYSGRTLLTVGLTTTLIGNLLLWALAHFSLPYPALLLGMLVAGAGAGLLNSETTKIMQGAIPAQSAGMASGLTAMTESPWLVRSAS